MLQAQMINIAFNSPSIAKTHSMLNSTLVIRPCQSQLGIELATCGAAGGELDHYTTTLFIVSLLNRLLGYLTLPQGLLILTCRRSS